MNPESNKRRLENLLEAYRRTIYRVEAPDGAIDVSIGSREPRLDALLERLGIDAWAFITAYNPGSVLRGREENERDVERLREDLAAEGYTTIEGEGVADGWPPERSLLVVGIRPERACAIGRRYGQIAIVVGHRGEKAELLLCWGEGEPAGIS